MPTNFSVYAHTTVSIGLSEYYFLNKLTGRLSDNERCMNTLLSLHRKPYLIYLDYLKISGLIILKLL